MKTKPTRASVDDYIDSIADERRRRECRTVARIMAEVTGCEPAMWGASMVGFDRYHYRYDSGREGDWFITGFAPRKAALTLYIMAGFDHHDDLMQRLGKFKTGKSCLYVKKLEDIDLTVLRELVAESVRHMRATWGTS